MADLKKLMEERVVRYDGSKGVFFQSMGYAELAETYNEDVPEAVAKIAHDYIAVGADAVQSNTFGANEIVLKNHGVERDAYEVAKKGMEIALSEAEAAGKTAVGDIGPTGRFLEPVGDMTYDEAYAAYYKEACALRDAGAKYAHVETATDLKEILIAMRAIKDAGGMETIVTASFNEMSRTLSGESAECVAIAAAAKGAIAVGANCSAPKALVEPLSKMAAVVSLPLATKPNAGIPETIDGKAVYTMAPEDFAKDTAALVKTGVRLIGGCCGTLPPHIEALKAELEKTEPAGYPRETADYICSAREFVEVPALSDMDVCEISAELAADDDEYSILDEVMDNWGGGAMLIKTAAMGEDLVKRMLDTVTMSVKSPLAFASEDDETLGLLLKYYVGRAGAVAANDAQKQIIAEEGAALLG